MKILSHAKNVTYILLTFIISSCGALNVYVNTDTTYTKDTPITIAQSKDDKTGTLGELSSLLHSNGYKLMSYAAAKKAFNLDSSFTDNRNYHSELTNTTQFRSCYILQTNYTYEWELTQCYYHSFSATITDLVSGEVVMTANFRGYNSVSSVLEQLVTEMNKVIQ